MPLRLVSLDLDGTLIHPAIFNAVADPLGFGEPLQKSYEEYVAGRMSLEDAFFHDYEHFVGRKIADMLTVLRISNAWTPGIGRAVQRMRDEGLGVIVTTDQPRFLAEATLGFGVNDVVCSEADVRDGIVTGLVEPEFAKWPNLEAFLEQHDFAPSDVAHVGNGTNDIPVFEKVGFSVAVNALHPSVNEAADVSIAKLHDLNEVADIILARRAGK